MKQPALFPGIPAKEIKEKQIWPTDLLGPISENIGYENYLKSYEWRQKAKAAIKYSENKCQECGTVENLEVHHLNYDNLYKERYCDVKVLCKKSCHKNADFIREDRSKYESFLKTKYGDNYAAHTGEDYSIADYEYWKSNKD